MTAPTTPRRHKYNAKPVVACRACGTWHQPPFDWRGACINCRGGEAVRFASQLEARRFAVLEREERSGAISALTLQPRFPIAVNGIKICTVVADFSYVRAGERRCEDAKGKDLPLSRLKRKLVWAVHGVTIEIVGA